MAFTDSVVEVKKANPVASKQRKKPKHVGENTSEGTDTRVTTLLKF